MGLKVALLDADNWGKTNPFPNLPLMKLSAYYKKLRDDVEWYDPSKHYDLCLVSKVFSFTEEPGIAINAKKVKRGGTGYCIETSDGIELFDDSRNANLPNHIEHIYPDYSIYGDLDTAYGFLTRGCPRGCGFCHVAAKEGQKSYKVANLDEFWRGQKNIELLDPNTFASPDWRDVADQLIQSKANINFNQGVDVRVLNEEKIDALRQMKVRFIHLAWDRYEDKDIILPKLKQFKELTGWNKTKVTVYILTNYNTTIEQDIERVETIKKLNLTPYVMRYDKEHIKRGSDLNKLARYANAKWICWKCPSFEQYKIDIADKKWR